MQVSGQAVYWLDTSGQSKFENLVGSPGQSALATPSFAPLLGETLFRLEPEHKLWIKMDVQRAAQADPHVVFWIPLSLIDSVILHQKSETNTWRIQSAGDKVAVKDWPEPGRHPRFHLDLPAGSSTLYLQIQGSTPLSLALHIGSENTAQVADRHGFLGLGVVVGLLLTLVLMCMVTAYTYRDRLYMLYGVYVLAMILAVCAYTGLAGYLLWPSSPEWSDASQGILAMLTAGGALYFIESILGGRQFARKLARALNVLGALAIPLSVLYYNVPRSVGVAILGVYMLVVSTTALTLAFLAWKRGDKVGRWVAFAYIPLLSAVLIALARAYGWISVTWIVQYGLILALLVEVPMMMIALNVRSRERHEIQTRELAMVTQDALTGLLNEHIFDDRVRQTLARAKKRKEDAAVVVISLVNYQAIVAAYGLPVAEQSVLRAVIKLRKVLRDVDTVARVGTSQFGLILDGVSHRSRITDIGARLIAQGLMPLPGLVPEVTLQFHISAAVMRELPGAESDLKAELLTILASMSRRTRRPIRFLEALTTGGSPLAAMPSKPTPVDLLALQVARSVVSVPAEQGSTLVMTDSSGPGEISSGHGDSSIRSGDTVVDIR
jgi:two-component system, sensor histidine kinase LadS